MRRVWAAALALVLLLCGCGAQAPEEPESELTVVGVSQLGAESDWRVANTESMRSVFTEQSGYRLLFDDARQKQENQITAVRKFIQQRVDYIVIMPLSEAGWDSVLQEARDAGIPVILVDRMVTVADESLYAAHIGSDFLREGEMAVEWLEERFPRSALNILHIQGTLGSSAQLGRTAALETAAQRNDGWEIIAQLDGDFTRAKAYSVVREYLSGQETRPDIDVVYCENDNEAFGTIQALEEAGYVCGRGGVTVVSFDATRAGLTACLEGKIQLDVECNPLLAPLVEETIRQLKEGRAPQKQQYAQEQCFDRSSLTNELVAARPY